MPIWDIQGTDFTRDEEKHCPNKYDSIQDGNDKFALRHEFRIHQLTTMRQPNPLTAGLGRPTQPEIAQIILFYCVFCRTLMTLESLGGKEAASDE